MKTFKFERRVQTEAVDETWTKITYGDYIIHEDGKEELIDKESSVTVPNDKVKEVHELIDANFEELKKYVEEHPEMYLVPDKLQ